jgi:membrane-bound lytic murein transglycosylase B
MENRVLSCLSRRRPALLRAASLLNTLLAAVLLAAAPATAAHHHGHAVSKTRSASKPAARPGPPLGNEAAVQEFVSDFVARNGGDAAALLQAFRQAPVLPGVLQAIAPPSHPGQRSWERYRPRFVNAGRIERGLRFWERHADTLSRAAARYGVPEEIIVGIIGVETEYGRNMGQYAVLAALGTLAFHYPRRAEFFREELEHFLLLCRENRLDPLQIRGSFAGAIGIPQFMPGSQRRYGVDFDGDGRVDLAGSPEDAIGSVAHFLQQHGWQRGERVALPTRIDDGVTESRLNTALSPDGRPNLDWRALGELGIRIPPLTDAGDLPAKATLIDLTTPDEATEYWLGFSNFYVITRYNRSNFYAMSVHQLAQAIRERRE